MLLRGTISKLIMIFSLLGFMHADDIKVYYNVYKTAKYNYLLGDIVSNLKFATPDDIRSGGFIKFNTTLYFDESKLQGEVSAKEDIIRYIIILAVSEFDVNTLQSSSGKKELADSIVANVNLTLTTGQIRGVAFGDFVIQQS